MSNEVALYEAELAEVKQSRNNYLVTSKMTGTTVTLKRDIDFGVIPKTKSPSLYKAGAEKVCAAFGLLQRYSIESKIEHGGDNPLFGYVVKCALVKIANDGTEYEFANGYGSANTAEKRNGFNGAYDAWNSTLKMAQKRALVAAAISVGSLSSMFTQDMENESFMQNYDNMVKANDDEAQITAKQCKRIFALAADKGYNAEQAKQKLAAAGYTSLKDVKQKDYDAVCAVFAE